MSLILTPFCPARERAGPVYVIRLACPCVIVLGDTGRKARRRARTHGLVKSNIEHASGWAVLAVERD